MKFSEQDRFEIWLMEMDDAIQRFIDVDAAANASEFNFTSESLSVIEKWLLDRYSDPNEIMRPEEARIHDAAARYIGQSFRQSLGGVWKIDFSDAKNAFFGIPQIAGMRGQKTQFCPYALVTSLLDRRKGNYLITIFNAMSSSA
ncbi:hypothetical protein KTE26_19300 [Ralstonia mannitolilytica]|uniref:hypothetical protein n=1 Tax=Ralstonia mannitolilytica TaxID=105219 RepID=UPI000CEE8137|nr:hypothetical protein [Ralstonia mannitolilytica]MBU9580587.1 hypothetical protein [Ralstonia mannitolilytica]